MYHLLVFLIKDILGKFGPGPKIMNDWCGKVTPQGITLACKKNKTLFSAVKTKIGGFY
jgi:hypothetical protein